MTQYFLNTKYYEYLLYYAWTVFIKYYEYLLYYAWTVFIFEFINDFLPVLKIYLDLSINNCNNVS